MSDVRIRTKPSPQALKELYTVTIDGDKITIEFDHERLNSTFVRGDEEFNYRQDRHWAIRRVIDAAEGLYQDGYLTGYAIRASECTFTVRPFYDHKPCLAHQLLGYISEQLGELEYVMPDVVTKNIRRGLIYTI